MFAKFFKLTAAAAVIALTSACSVNVTSENGKASANDDSDFVELEDQINNRNTLRNIMLNNGFKPLDTEWWHFTLENEPYPDTYFDFPISEDTLSER